MNIYEEIRKSGNLSDEITADAIKKIVDAVSGNAYSNLSGGKLSADRILDIISAAEGFYKQKNLQGKDKLEAAAEFFRKEIKKNIGKKYAAEIKKMNGKALVDLKNSKEKQEVIDGQASQTIALESLKKVNEYIGQTGAGLREKFMESPEYLHAVANADYSKIAHSFSLIHQGDFDNPANIFRGNKELMSQFLSVNGRADALKLQTAFGMIGDPKGTLTGNPIFDAEKMLGFAVHLNMVNQIKKIQEEKAQQYEQVYNKLLMQSHQNIGHVTQTLKRIDTGLLDSSIVENLQAIMSKDSLLNNIKNSRRFESAVDTLNQKYKDAKAEPLKQNQILHIINALESHVSLASSRLLYDERKSRALQTVGKLEQTYQYTNSIMEEERER